MKKILKLFSLGIMLALVALIPMGCSDNSVNETRSQPKPERTVCTVTFHAGDGKFAYPDDEDESVLTEEVYVGDYVSEPGERNIWYYGYTLAGWYKDAEYKTKFSFRKPIYENIDLYAKWETAVYDVEFRDYCGGTGLHVRVFLFF